MLNFMFSNAKELEIKAERNYLFIKQIFSERDEVGTTNLKKKLITSDSKLLCASSVGPSVGPRQSRLGSFVGPLGLGPMWFLGGYYVTMSSVGPLRFLHGRVLGKYSAGP